MPTDSGKHVTCHDWAPKQQSRGHSVSRALCLLGQKDYCPSCVHSRFTMKISVGAGDQPVSCPRWESSADRSNNLPPITYSPVRRETCLRVRPFEFCPSCPNSKSEEDPYVTAGWYKDWKKK